MSMVFCSSLMLEKSSNHSSSTRDLKIYLAIVMNKTPYSHFLLTVFTQCYKKVVFILLTWLLEKVLEVQLQAEQASLPRPTNAWVQCKPYS